VIAAYFRRKQRHVHGSNSDPVAREIDPPLLASADVGPLMNEGIFWASNAAYHVKAGLADVFDLAVRKIHMKDVQAGYAWGHSTPRLPGWAIAVIVPESRLAICPILSACSETQR